MYVDSWSCFQGVSAQSAIKFFSHFTAKRMLFTSSAPPLKVFDGSTLVLIKCTLYNYKIHIIDTVRDVATYLMVVYVWLTCAAITCEDLTDPENGRVSVPSNNFTSVATYSCDLGFNLIGQRTRMCMQNRIWSGMPPRCDG